MFSCFLSGPFETDKDHLTLSFSPCQLEVELGLAKIRKGRILTPYLQVFSPALADIALLLLSKQCSPVTSWVLGEEGSLLCPDPRVLQHKPCYKRLTLMFL